VAEFRLYKGFFAAKLVSITAMYWNEDES
jgi:hypothetical protein